MSWNNIHAKDYGWTGEIILVQDRQVVNISSFTNLKFVLRSPSGAISEKTAVFSTDGSNGALRRVFLIDDITVPGDWEVQAQITKDGTQLTSDEIKFRVKPRRN